MSGHVADDESSMLLHTRVLDSEELRIKQRRAFGMGLATVIPPCYLLSRNTNEIRNKQQIIVSYTRLKATVKATPSQCINSRSLFSFLDSTTVTVTATSITRPQHPPPHAIRPRSLATPHQPPTPSTQHQHHHQTPSPRPPPE